MKMRTTAAALVLAMTVPTGTALAQDAATRVDIKQIDVTYGDLDLTTRDGARKMLGRLSSAARRACGNPGKEIDVIRTWRACTEIALRKAVVDVNAPMVTALYSDAIQSQEQFASARSRTE
jgi:UrcA family protein